MRIFSFKITDRQIRNNVFSQEHNWNTRFVEKNKLQVKYPISRLLLLLRPDKLLCFYLKKKCFWKKAAVVGLIFFILLWSVVPSWSWRSSKSAPDSFPGSVKATLTGC